jgi:glc operon protein GlcG
MAAIESVPNLTAAGARLLIDAAVAEADGLGVAVVIAVVDRGGNPLALLRMDGAPLFSVEVAEKKAWTAAAGRGPTDAMREVFNADPTLIHALAPKVDRLMAVGGGAPVRVDGAVAGAVGVSGASEAQDQQIANAAVRVVSDTT